MQRKKLLYEQMDEMREAKERLKAVVREALQPIVDKARPYQPYILVIVTVYVLAAMAGTVNATIDEINPEVHYQRIHIIEVKEEAKKIEAEVSAYTSAVEETDENPHETASGTRTRSGVIANNCLKFGTEVRIEGKRYVVEDRMNRRYGCEHFDIWMESRERAIEFGRRELAVAIYER